MTAGGEDDLFAWAGRYPDKPGFKEGDTAREAAEDIAARAHILRARCLDYIAKHPAHTADEIAQALEETPFAVRPRISELRLKGWVTNHGRGVNRSGKAAHRWVTTEYLAGLK